MQVDWHRLIIGLLAAMHNMHKTGKGAAVNFWVLKALAQLVDLCIYNADQATVAKAENALVTGEAVLTRLPFTQLPECVCQAA